jgi:hypothetical protein
MLTLFTTAKPFEGHSGVIQRNALKSWKLLHPDIEIILFGDDAAHILRERGEATNPGRFWAPYWRYLRPKCIPIWFAILHATRPV